MVEVVTVLDPADKRAFDDLVIRLRDDDPDFLGDVDRLPGRRARRDVAIAVTLGMLAPSCIVLGGWTGLFVAAVAGAYAGHLLVRRVDTPALPASWWRTPGGRPDATPFC